jgi:hypothetical protein
VGDQRAKHHRRGAGIVEGSVGRRHVQTELLHQPRQPRGLPFGKVENEPGQRRGVDDRMLQWALKPATDEPRVEGVVAVLNENGALSKPQEGPTRIPEFRRSDQHGAVDVVALACVGIDRRAAVDEGVEEGQWTVETEALGAELQDQERRVARGLDVDRDELSVLQPGPRRELGCIDGDLLPRHRLGRTARLEEDRLRNHRAGAKARRAKRISSGVTALSSKTAAA